MPWRTGRSWSTSSFSCSACSTTWRCWGLRGLASLKHVLIVAVGVEALRSYADNLIGGVHLIAVGYGLNYSPWQDGLINLAVILLTAFVAVPVGAQLLGTWQGRTPKQGKRVVLLILAVGLLAMALPFPLYAGAGPLWEAIRPESVTGIWATAPSDAIIQWLRVFPTALAVWLGLRVLTTSSPAPRAERTFAPHHTTPS